MVEERFELPFDLLLAHGLARMCAALGLAEIIGIFPVPPRGPGGGHGPLAAGTGDKTSQREVVPHVPAYEGPLRLVQALQYALVRFIGDERLVPALHQGNAPFAGLDVPGVEGAFQKVPDALLVDGLAAPVEEAGIAVEVALDLHLGGKPARREAFEHVADDRGSLWVRDEHLATFPGLFVAIAHRGAEHPESGQHARPHLLADLPAVLLALQLGLRRDNGLDELAFRRILEPEIETGAGGVPKRHLVAELEVEDRVAGIALEVVEDHHKGAVGMIVEIA
nr:hypothetical protein [Xanthobacter autotrophicus]